MMRRYEPDGTTYSHSLESDVDESGGGYMYIGCGQPSTDVIVDGNYGNSNNPYIVFIGVDRSTIFNMGGIGDDAVMLPYSAISSSEMWNEAGVANSVLPSVVPLSSSPTTILTRKMWFSTSGYAVVIGTACYNFWHDSGTSDQLKFGISQTQGVFPADQDNYRDYPPNRGDFNFKDNITVHDYYIVNEGLNIFYFLGEHIGSPHGGAVVDANLTVMFFPT